MSELLFWLFFCDRGAVISLPFLSAVGINLKFTDIFDLQVVVSAATQWRKS
jgi:hypothetical protein